MAIKHNIEFKHFEPQERIRSLIESLIAKLERKVRNFSPDPLFLWILIEQNKVRTLYHVSTTMEVPGKTLATKEERHEVEASIKDAFAEIERQLMAHKSRLRGEHLWNRLAKRKKIHRVKVKASPDAVEERRREIFFSLVRPHIDKVDHLARHMIRFYETTGELVRGELDPAEIVDSALARAHHELLRGRPSQDITNRLIRVAMNVLDAEVALRKRERERTLHLEDYGPETSVSEEVSTLGDEILDFYQPDGDLKIEDIVPGIEAPTPEQIVETRELQRLIRTLLGQMPAEWRRALLLHDIGGRTEAEVANAVGRPEAEVKRITDRSREYLRQKLIDNGYGLKRAA